MNEQLVLSSVRQHELTDAAEKLNAELQAEIAQRKQVEEALRTAQAQLANRAAQLEGLVTQRTAKLQETIGELEGFSYSSTHDLRAPLRAMQGFSHMLEKGYGDKLDDAGKGFLRRIRESANRMDKLIQDVLQYSQVLRLDLRLERVDADAAFSNHIRIFKSHRPKSSSKAKCPPCWATKRR
jgi:light-regulated signal transduction histidine kinase (bacteriophytochrome)